MGLIYSNARFLLSARQAGCSFNKTLTLGRQQIHLTRKEYSALRDEFGNLPLVIKPADSRQEAYADDFFHQSLGCQQLDALDYSDYQAANIHHDLNLPVESTWHQRYDAVVDCGTIEHIFNVPVALRSCMQMVRVGGCLMLATVANNHCGHGFYQFSPELFFRIFQPINGFELLRVVLMEHPYPGAELSQRQRCYEVTDPDAIGSRVGLVHDSPVMVQVLARRTSEGPILESYPQQSDYQTLWQSHLVSDTTAPTDSAPPRGIARLRRIVGNLKRNCERRLPCSLQRRLNGRRQLRDYSLKNRKFYRPL